MYLDYLNMNSSLYRQEILDHARNPHNFGKLDKADAFLHEANLSCGDEITLYLKYGKKNRQKIVNQATFEGRGCILCLAGASMLTEYINSKPVEKLKKMKERNALAMFGHELTPSRTKCALLSFEALNKLVNA